MSDAEKPARTALSKAEAWVDPYTRKYYEQTGHIPDHNPTIRDEELGRAAAHRE